VALQYDTKYYYKIGTEEEGPREFFFTTPPAPGPDSPYTFGLIGELSFLLLLVGWLVFFFFFFFFSFFPIQFECITSSKDTSFFLVGEWCRGFGTDVRFSQHFGTLPAELWPNSVVCGGPRIPRRLPISLPSPVRYVESVLGAERCVPAFHLDIRQSRA
jgi:hypothetical protein